MEKISCETCKAACCQGGTIELTLEEAAFMIRGGNKLKTFAQPTDYDRDDVFCPQTSFEDEQGQTQFVGTKESLKAGLGRYFMLGACKYLEQAEEGWQKCGVYDDRPGTCRRFEAGGGQCLILRQVMGVDEMTESTKRAVDFIEKAMEQ